MRRSGGEGKTFPPGFLRFTKFGTITFFTEQLLTEYHYRLPLAIGSGPFYINQFYGGSGHFPYLDYLWGERMGDAIDLKTGKIFYVKIPPFCKLALLRMLSPEGRLYHISADGIYQIALLNQ